MPTVTVKRTINAPFELIFRTVTDIENLPHTNPDIVSIEFLTEQRSGVGTRFRETRRMKKGRELQTELEVTEYDPAGSVRMVADSHGTIWDTVFRVTPTRTGAELVIRMDCRAHKLLPKLINPLFKGLFKRGMNKHMDELKTYCEARS